MEIQQQVEAEIKEGIQFAYDSPELPDEALFKDIYVEENE